MFPVGVLRKNFSFDQNSEPLNTWVATNNDLEVSLVKSQGTFQVLAFIICPSNLTGHFQDDDMLIQVDCMETEDLDEAEEHFISYTSNFL